MEGLGFCRISGRWRAGPVNCGAESRTNRHAQLQRDALSDRCDPGLHPMVCGLSAELPAPRGDHGRARRVGRPFVDQPLGGSFPAAYREDGPETQAPGRGSWRMDETYIKVKSVWKCLYRAVDKHGKTVDFLLTAKRDMAAAKRFFDKAMGANGNPDKVAMDKSGANKAAMDAINADRDLPILVRQVKYLNNIVEQDHRAIKRLTRPMLNFKSFRAAGSVLAGIELIHMIRKGQFAIDGTEAMSLADHFSALAGMVCPV
jgi:putative transposase